VTRGTDHSIFSARTAQFQRYFNAVVGQKHFVRKNYQAVVATHEWQAFLAKNGKTEFPIDLTHWTSRKWSDNDSHVIPESARPPPGQLEVQRMTVESGVIQRTLVNHVPDEEYCTELRLRITCARGVSPAPASLNNDACQQLHLTDSVTFEQCAPLTPFDRPWLSSVARDLTQHNHVPPLVMLDIELLTGKTHQIRAQLTHEGMTILGDALYGNKHVLEPDMWALCCSQLSFPCPFSLDDNIAREGQTLTGVTAGFQLHHVLRGKSQPHVFKPESWLKFDLQQHRHSSDT
jgi:hypothetical protein